MAKKVVFVVRSDFPSIMYKLLEQSFKVVSWNSEQGEIPRNQLLDNVKGVFGLICYPFSTTIDKEILNAAGSNLKVVSTFSTGFDHIDTVELKSRGIKIGYTPDFSPEPVAEYAIGLLIATGRRIVEGHRFILKGEWNSKTWTPLWMSGRGLNSSRVGVIGCGRIGLSVLQKIKAFNPRDIFYFSRTTKPQANELGAKLKSIDFIMRECDFVIVSLALNVETRGIISKERINYMKPNAVIVNIGRGGLIDENSLIEALQCRRIGGAGLDVFNKEPLPLDSPLLKLDNIVITPHIAGALKECRTAMAKLTALNVLAVYNNQKMPSEV